MSGIAAGLALRLSYELEGIATHGDFLRTAAESMEVLLPTDFLGWAAVDLIADDVEIYDRSGHPRPEIVQAFARLADVNPMWPSYRDRPGDMTPRRMSDVIAPREWRSHPVYSEVFKPLGVVHQVTVMVSPLGVGSWAGWGFGRATGDFTDDEMVTAARLQPVLMALNHAGTCALRRCGFRPVDSSAGPGGSGRPGGSHAA